MLRRIREKTYRKPLSPNVSTLAVSLVDVAAAGGETAGLSFSLPEVPFP